MAGPAETLPTIRVRDKKKDIVVTINEQDFNEARYERVDTGASSVPARRSELAGMKTIELRELAEGYGLSAEGKKQELVDRIFEYETEERE